MYCIPRQSEGFDANPGRGGNVHGSPGALLCIVHVTSQNLRQQFRQHVLNRRRVDLQLGRRCTHLIRVLIPHVPVAAATQQLQ